MDLEGKKVVVVGLGRSGIAAAQLLNLLGADVWVTDRRSRQELSQEVDRLRDLSIQFVFEGHPASVFSEAALVVISPGVPSRSLSGCRAPVIGEMELAFGHLTAPVVAITGTNGKSTTAALVGEIFRGWGKRVFVGGNLGIPLCEAAISTLSASGGGKAFFEWIVAEASSFQLETIEAFRPQIAVLLNVTPNHQDRYTRFEDYLHAKLRIFSNQTGENFAVVNLDDEASRSFIPALKARKVAISRKESPSQGVWIEGEHLVSNLNGRKVLAHRSEILLRGEHNLSNVLAAAAVAQLSGCPVETIHRTVTQFQGLEHRLETVRRIRDVLYVNDSKATTVDAMIGALESFEEPVILIAGGRDKGGDFTRLQPILLRKALAVILIGEAREKIRSALKGTVPIYEAMSLEEAVERAATLARPGHVVLMAPGCVSFDMFHDFEDRGRQFKQIVAAL